MLVDAAEIDTGSTGPAGAARRRKSPISKTPAWPRSACCGVQPRWHRPWGLIGTLDRSGSDAGSARRSRRRSAPSMAVALLTTLLWCCPGPLLLYTTGRKAGRPGRNRCGQCGTSMCRCSFDRRSRKPAPFGNGTQCPFGTTRPAGGAQLSLLPAGMTMQSGNKTSCDC